MDTDYTTGERNDKTYQLVIDADSILYTACYNNQAKGKLDQEAAYIDFVAKVARMKSMIYSRHWNEHVVREWRGKPIVEGLNIEVTAVFSPKETFRHELSPIYKANRKPTEIVGINELKMLVKTRFWNAGKGYDTAGGYKVEADDIVIWNARYKENVYIGAIDKDVIMHSPVDCINYNEWTWNEAKTEEEIEENYWYQALVGDPTDNIKGAPGIGKKTAEQLVYGGSKLEDFIGTRPEEGSNHFGWEQYLEAYKGNEDEAILNMRLVRLDQMNEKGDIKLWKPY